jgi:predicted RNase H-like HicB family nuclease
MGVRYYSLIRCTTDGMLVGWVPDLPGVTASGREEEDVLRELTLGARELLCKIARKGLPKPRSSPPDALPLGDRHGPYRRLLLVLG